MTRLILPCPTNKKHYISISEDENCIEISEYRNNTIMDSIFINATEKQQLLRVMSIISKERQTPDEDKYFNCYPMDETITIEIYYANDLPNINENGKLIGSNDCIVIQEVDYETSEKSIIGINIKDIKSIMLHLNTKQL